MDQMFVRAKEGGTLYCLSGQHGPNVCQSKRRGVLCIVCQDNMDQMSVRAKEGDTLYCLLGQHGPNICQSKRRGYSVLSVMTT